MIVDCTMFHWEFDLLELRMKELWDAVDYFVVTESVCDHRGKERDLVLSNNISQFDWASEKLIVNISDKPKDAEISWDYEKYQRLKSVESAISMLKLNSEDFILISDVDEIFRSDSVKKMSEEGGRYRIHMPMYYYYLNLFAYDWFLPKASSLKTLTNPNDMRTGNEKNFYYVYNGGWHFSYLGTPEQIQYKLKTFAHDEMDTNEFTDIENIKKNIVSRKDLFNRFGNNNFQVVDIDSSWPNYVLEKIDKYQNFIL
jgi:hypothetical protein